MESDRISKISHVLNTILEFLQPFTCLLNCHIVNFITDRLWEELPEGFQNELFSLNKEVVYEMLWNRGQNTADLSNSSEISRFISQCWEMSLDSKNFSDIVESLESLQRNLEALSTSPENTPLTCLPYYMSQKKTHEVEVFSNIVVTAAKISNTSFVVDVGGGKGYLGTVLALHQDLKVLSVDSSDINTSEAMKLSRKIEGLHKKKNKNLMEKCVSDHNYKGVTAYISSKTDLSVLVKEHFSLNVCDSFLQASAITEEVSANKKQLICLTGLHTCGNLGPASIKLFCSNSDAKSLCSVGCCYNLMSEAFDHNTESFPDCPKERNNFFHGFPMSMLLQQRRTTLGRNARMLAAQALHRIAHKKLVMPDSLFFRAVLEVCLKRSLGLHGSYNVGRIGSRVKTLEEYLLKSEKKLNANLQLSEDAICKLVKDTSKYRNCMEIFYILRLALAPVVEAIILLDRLLYLNEQGAKPVYLAQIFDSIISPRCFGIIAFKS